MDDLDQFLKPQIDQLKEVYRLGFEAGRRAAFRELHSQIESIQEQLGKPIQATLRTHIPSTDFSNKNEGADAPPKPQGE